MDGIKVELGVDEVLKTCSERLSVLSKWSHVPVESIVPIINALIEVLGSEINKEIIDLHTSLKEEIQSRNDIHKEYVAYRVRNPENQETKNA